MGDDVDIASLFAESTTANAPDLTVETFKNLMAAAERIIANEPQITYGSTVTVSVDKTLATDSRFQVGEWGTCDCGVSTRCVFVFGLGKCHKCLMCTAHLRKYYRADSPHAAMVLAWA